MKAIELTELSTGDKVLVNTDHITAVMPANDGLPGTYVVAAGLPKALIVSDDYAGIRSRLLGTVD